MPHRWLFLPGALIGLILVGSPGSPQDLSDEVLKGFRLTAPEVATLERQLEANPSDLAVRARLLGYYWRQHRTGGAKHVEHVLWFIDNDPESSALEGPQGSVFPMRNPDGYLQVKEAWLRKIEREPTNAVLLKRAADSLSLTDRDLSADLLTRAEALAPADPDWAKELGALRWLEAHNPFDGPDRDKAAAALAHFERAYELSGDVGRADLLPHLAMTAFVAEDLQRAQDYAEAALEPVAEESVRGRNIHFGNLVLGRIALVDGDVEEAGSRLLAAGRTEGSATLKSFGPDMALAKALLDQGERQTVVRYLELCLDFWESGQDSLRDWIALVEAGRTPDFSRNLRF